MAGPDRRVAIVGAGPAGLAAALALKRCGIADILVLERESEAGGVPRHCGHPPFGLREFGRVMTGPTYARHLRTAAGNAGIEVRTGWSVLRLHPGGRLDLATPEGIGSLTAARVLLATGARETPRAARLVGGDRPQGVLTTGALQALIHLERLVPFRRPVVVGTELVSFSALLTCRHAGIVPAAMIEDGPRTIARRPAAVLARALGVPVLYRTGVEAVLGRSRVAAVRLTRADGSRVELACDGVVFTGRFQPVAELVRASHLAFDPGSGGPAIDQYGRCSDPAYFAAGNLLRAVETAGWSFREGRTIGGVIADDLEGRLPPASRCVAIGCRPLIKLTVPQRLALPLDGRGLDALQIRLDRPVRGVLSVEADGVRLWRRRLTARPERRILVRLAGLLPPPAETERIVVAIEGESV
jgi:NADPH-dependent 2,4-dienoyl-CoA reductase/sulfur reductase-like enzyme